MLYHQKFAALGSQVEFYLNFDAKTNPEMIFSTLYEQVVQFEQRCSRFLPDSELSKFNQAAGSWQQVSPELLDILKVSRYYGQLTNGYFNPFILPILQRVGYKDSLANYSKNIVSHDYSARRVVEVDRLEFKDQTARIPQFSAIDLEDGIVITTGDGEIEFTI